MITGWIGPGLSKNEYFYFWTKSYFKSQIKVHLIADDTLKEIIGWLKSIKETANGDSLSAQEIRNCAQYCLDELEVK